jgi:hypothetical protein
LRHFYAASTGETIQFDNACVVVFVPFAVGRLIATFKGKIALPKPGIRQNRRSCGGTAGISTSFFASKKTATKNEQPFAIPGARPCREKVRS